MSHLPRLRRGPSLAVLATALLALLLPSSAHAIVYGQPDKENKYSNVGSFVALADPGNGESPRPIQLCTGTLVSPRVVLTASHCMQTDEWPANWDRTKVWFTLDPVIDADGDWAVDPDVTLLSGDPRPHPKYAGSAHYRYDVGGFVLDEAVTGVAPGVLAPVGTLDQRSLRGSTFTTVGYGIVRETRRKSTQSFLPPQRRMVAEQPLVTVTRDLATFSMNQARGHGGTCYGDSGGPHLDRQGRIVAVTTAGDVPCKSIDQASRADTAYAHEFIADLVEQNP